MSLLLLALAAPGHAQDAPAEPSADEEPSAEPQDADEAGRSFGAALDLYGLEVSWSGYGDFVVAWQPDGAFTFDATHFNPIVGARLHETLWAELELEFEHGGSEIKVEYGFVDWTPSPLFGVRIGQFLVPIGEFNETLHPSFRWIQATRPAMFRDVVPGVWNEVGMQVFGAAISGPLRVDWSAYTVNGLGGTWDAEAGEPVRALRGNVIDNNRDKAVGGRVGVGAHGAVDLRVTGSAYTGAVGDDGSRRISIVDGSLSGRAGPVRVLAEAATSFVAGDAFERGLYVQPSVRIGRFTPSARWDHVERVGGPTRGEAVGTILAQIKTFWSVRLDVAAPIYGEEAGEAPKLTAMSAFFF